MQVLNDIYKLVQKCATEQNLGTGYSETQQQMSFLSLSWNWVLLDINFIAMLTLTLVFCEVMLL